MNLSDIPSDHVNLLISKNLLNSYSNKFCKNLRKFIKDADPEAIHQLRVYSRRMITVFDFYSSVLPIKKISEWKRAFKKFLTSLNQPRDTHVQVEYIQHLQAKTKDIPNISSEIILYLENLEKKQQKQIKHALEGILKSRILDDIPKFCKIKKRIAYQMLSPSNQILLSNHCRAKIKPLLRDFIHFRKLIPDPEKIVELHKSRLIMKKIRYTIEILIPFFPSLKKFLRISEEMQTILGEIHDCDMWIDFLNTFSENLTIGKISWPKSKYYKMKKELKKLSTIRIDERKNKHQQLMRILNKYDHEAFEKQLIKVF